MNCFVKNMRDWYIIKKTKLILKYILKISFGYKY